MTLCRCNGKASAYFDTMTCASSAGPARPRSIGNDGSGACMIVAQLRQERIGRTCSTTLKDDGTYSSTSVTSSPILRSTVASHDEQDRGGACTTRSRGKCSGNGLRPRGLRSL